MAKRQKPTQRAQVRKPVIAKKDLPTLPLEVQAVGRRSNEKPMGRPFGSGAIEV